MIPNQKMILTLCFMLILIAFPVHSFATQDWKPEMSEVNPEKQALQQHLTLFELKRDLNRIEQEEAALEENLSQLQQKIQAQHNLIDQQKDKVGRMLRKYYTGQRHHMLDFILSSTDFNQLIYRSYIIKLIINRDLMLMDNYRASLDKLDDYQTELNARIEEVREIKQAYLDRLASIQQEEKALEATLQQVKDEKKLQLEKEQLLKEWADKGLPTFHQFFEALNQAIEQLPSHMQQHQIKSENFFRYTYTLTDEELNRFLREQNPIFANTRFSFLDDRLKIEGEYQDQQLQVVGEYELVSPGYLKFHIRSMVYQQFELPETTVEEMAASYDLGFYPDQLVNNLYIDDFVMKKGTLQMELKLKF
ncbi:MAG: hypothetical protein H0Z33_04635 [Bacillaceae bacterium]|nr:hypothetical protein [Bacillaceae bacterium]